MPTINDAVVRKPTEEEVEKCKAWPIWKSEPSSFDWEYTQTETCLIIEGAATVSDGSGSISFGAGDIVIFPRDLSCKWTVTKAISKYYNFG